MSLFGIDIEALTKRIVESVVAALDIDYTDALEALEKQTASIESLTEEIVLLRETLQKTQKSKKGS